jgi:hypothetical protein
MNYCTFTAYIYNSTAVSTTKLFKKLKATTYFGGPKAIFGIVGLLAVAGVSGVVLASQQQALRKNTPAPEQTAATSMAVSEQLTSAAAAIPKPTTAVPVTDQPEASLTTPSPAAATSSPQTIPAVPPEKQAACAEDVGRYTKSYERELDRTRKNLDSTLSFRTGTNISSLYVEEYNLKVAEILEKYTRLSRAENCVFPVTEPQLLPVTYPN